MSSSPPLITLAFSGPYADDSRAMWGSTQVHVFKASPCPYGGYYDRVDKDNVDLLDVDDAMSGA